MELELAERPASQPRPQPRPHPQAAMNDDDHASPHVHLHKRTVRKLDTLLLPFLALLFLFNSLDKSNIGNAESAHFTSDIGLAREDLNTAVALFFAFFVTLQPLGAALGRKYGMVLWVPSCMLLWGISTALHVWVTAKWQLYLLRILIGCLEAGFYPVTVSYLSLFYTRFEFGRRLSLFYGQAAVGGALGGIISYLVFSHFPSDHDDHTGQDHDGRWQSWQVLFLLEGGLTIIIAVVGYFWLPHSVETAWFLRPDERIYAHTRIIRDRLTSDATPKIEEPDAEEENYHDEESRGLLNPSRTLQVTNEDNGTITDDRGLTPHDTLAAFTNIKIWHILLCNVLSAVPVYAFQVFLPLVLAPLIPSDDEKHKADPALVNLLTAPPYVCGAITLYLFASYSDRKRIRITPILWGLLLLLIGLALVVMLPTSKAFSIPRYLALCVLLSGTFIASPLTVAWISGNTPSPGKRALMLGINGWGNLAGVLSALLFQPKYQASGYIVPFWWTLLCVGLAAAGYVLFRYNLTQENKSRQALLQSWDQDEVAAERAEGRGSLRPESRFLTWLTERLRASQLGVASAWLEEATQGAREGDERITFVYGL